MVWLRANKKVESTVPINYRRIRHCTEGEKLFLEVTGISRQLLSQRPISGSDFLRVSGREEFGPYLEGVVSVFAFRRIMKAASGVYKEIAVDADRMQRLNGFLRNWFHWLDSDDVAKLMRQTARAQNASHRPIPHSIREDVLGGSRLHRCCFCGTEMRRQGARAIVDENDRLGTLEHVWPTSLGGDSIEENLVPACHSCNREKEDLFAWEHGLVHESVYRIGFGRGLSSDTVSRKYKILLQRRAVLTLAERDKLTLKEALMRVGPYHAMEALDSADTWDFFNLQNHYESLGERLW